MKSTDTLKTGRLPPKNAPKKMPREIKKKVEKPKSTRSNVETKNTIEDKFITLSEEQLTKLIGLVTTQTTNQPIPGLD